MSSRLSDTSVQAERVQIEIMRAMPTWQRFRLWNDLIVTGRKLALAGLRERFPEANPEELHRRLAILLLGPELASKIYGPQPDPPTRRRTA